jgi:uncharacterized SAM-binding protein YcdF (DUF218 family)
VRRRERGGIFFRLLFLLVFIAFMALVYSVRHPLMRFAAEFWILNDTAVHSDAIVVLGDDNYGGDRAFHAAELYRSGIAPTVVASGRMLRANAGIADLIEHDLQSFGVPASSIVKFPHRASNTREEAEALSALIAGRGWKHVLLVTSNYHARRALFIFERTMAPGVSVRVSGARDSDFDPANWWATRKGQGIFLHEVVGFWEAWWDLRGRSAAPAGVTVLTPHSIPSMQIIVIIRYVYL